MGGFVTGPRQFFQGKESGRISSKFKAQSSKEAPGAKAQAPQRDPLPGIGTWSLRLLLSFEL
jgi:hypothetical protein